MKKVLFILSLNFVLITQVFAVTILPYPVQESFWHKVLRCTWHISCYSQKFGTTLTTVNSTDTLNNFPSVYNANNTALNNGKIEVSTTSVQSITTLPNLVSLGTITTGTWSATGITIAEQGTGTTTPTGLLWGNGAGVLQSIAAGTNGQFLTSSGAGVLPTYTTGVIDQTQAYNWTGNHNFTGTTLIKNLNASSTVIFNGVTYTLPPAQAAASSSVLTNDASGHLTWNNQDWGILADTVSAGGSATISANFATSSQIQIVLSQPTTLAGAASNTFFQFTNTGSGYYSSAYRNFGTSLVGVDNTDVNAQKISVTGNGTTSPQFLIIDIQNVATLAKNFKWTDEFNNVNGVQGYAGWGLWNNTAANITSAIVTLTGGSNWPSGTRLTIYGKRD